MPLGKMPSIDHKWESGDSLTDVLIHFKFVPFAEPHLTEGQIGAQPHTHFRDQCGRLMAVRTSIPAFLPALLTAIGPAAAELCCSIKLSRVDRLINHRGPHFASNFGADQQSKPVIQVTGFHRTNELAFDKFWSPTMKRINNHVSSAVRIHFPTPKDNKERIWIVLWEAGLVIQLPLGALFLFPSALLVHFNVKIEDIEILATADGAFPTKDNTTPIGTRQDDDRGARCSMVWYSQASCFHAAELAFTTVKATQAAEKEAQRKAPRAEPYYPTSFDHASALSEQYFPTLV
ncbi:hypothetical protein EIP91_004531 [Steccherinum ochraceum]|uniref:Uncharacterized protein n=1 Tax=Steccherinum ochraceum TaxID=92696 RepID=A0A4R0RK09_9APHY|nr:hypothetical protein EIP91_004531 [Steccherinum ochraceum]